MGFYGRPFEQGAYDVDGVHYYGLDGLPDRLSICKAPFPRERELSLLVPRSQKLARDLSEERTIASKDYDGMKLTARVNKNLMAFYETYPTSMLNDNIVSRWAMYANTPMDGEVKGQAYDSLREMLKGLSQKDAVSRLLNMLQTGLEYEYDSKVWGHDRAFFSEETLYYPYADCEDRAILLSRLVRDLLGLRCILVFYPGHLAMAVGFTEEVKGDYILLDNSRYVVCDPTYIGAPVGVTMKGMDNASAKVILLE